MDVTAVVTVLIAQFEDNFDAALICEKKGFSSPCHLTSTPSDTPDSDREDPTTSQPVCDPPTPASSPLHLGEERLLQLFQALILLMSWHSAKDYEVYGLQVCSNL